jgi:eukaryotic-like serine/threonine-protein kinase
LSVPRRLSDRYDLEEILGFGGMSEVHRARDVRLDRDVAVKLLSADLARDPDCYLRFRREAQHAAALNHPAIVAVYDTGTVETDAGPLPYIVMEYVDGCTLRDIVHDEGPIEQRRSIEIIADVCQALNFSHLHGIIHRDVKPANIMIGRTGAVKVMDFGIARTLTESGKKLTQTAAILGTAHYLSPEQARGETVDARSDVYSLACVLYEILTGETPFVGESPVSVAFQHVRADPTPPSQRHDGISSELDAVILKGLAKNPDNRYQTAAEMRADLIHVHNGEMPTAPKVLTQLEPTEVASVPPVSPAEPASGRPWLVTAVILAVLAVTATIAFWAIGNRNQGPAVRVPDVHGQSEQDAIAALQDIGFEIRGPVQKPDPAVPIGHVIDTVPGAHTALAGGDAITITVSSGPEQREVPDCSNKAVAECIRVLGEAGFNQIKQLSNASDTVPQNTVITTFPAAGRQSVLDDDITVMLSTGPESRRVPDVTAQSVDDAIKNLKSAGFATVLTGPVDSTAPAGRVVSTDPRPGERLSVRSAVMVMVSRGNQMSMPNLIGMTYVEIGPYLVGLGHSGTVLNAGDVPGNEQDKDRVVEQNPSAGTAVNREGTVTLKFGS